MSTQRKLLELYTACRERFGPQHWWPSQAGADTAAGKLEICVGAILTQNTNWGNVEKALANLQAEGCLSIEALHAIPHAALAKIIRTVGYFNIKAKRLKNFIAHVQAGWGEDIEAFLDRPIEPLREELLGINGIGRETADSMILYAAGRATFVVDAYTARVFLRHFLIGPEDDYESIKELCELSLPNDADLYNDFHAQLVRVGKGHCKPKPQCAGCPLESFPHDIHAGLEF
jgi:endonuclease-3 related protein